MDLREAPLFSHFTREQIVLLGRCGFRQRWAPGARILPEEGDRHVFVLLKGRVKVHRETPYGPFQLASFGSGNLVGEAGLLDPSLTALDVSAETEVDALALDVRMLRETMSKNRGFDVAVYWTIWKSLSRKLRDCNDKLTRFFSTSGQPRVEEETPFDASGEFKIDIEAKRAVFRQNKLSSMEINFLASLSKAKRLAPNEVLFREGDPGDRLYIVVEGRVMISKDIPGAGEEALAFLGRGEIFGEMALIDRAPRSADAKADKDGAIVLSIRRQVLDKVLNIEKVTSSRLLKVLCHLIARRLRDAHEKIVGWYILSGGARAI